MSEKSPPQQPVVRLYERSSAPEFFASDLAGMFMQDGVVTLTFQNVLGDHTEPPGAPNRFVAGRVAMPLPAAQRLALSLYDFLKQRGFDPANVIETAGDPGKPQ